MFVYNKLKNVYKIINRPMVYLAMDLFNKYYYMTLFTIVTRMIIKVIQSKNQNLKSVVSN